MIATPVSAERVEKYVFNFEIYRLLKKRPIYPIFSYGPLTDLGKVYLVLLWDQIPKVSPIPPPPQMHPIYLGC